LRKVAATARRDKLEVTYWAESKIMMDKDTKFIILVLGLPVAGLLYGGIIVALMVTQPTFRDHPLGFGFLFFLIPFIIAATAWIRASAKAYRN
jgi:hypothetical protein